MEEGATQKQIGVRIVSCVPAEFHQFPVPEGTSVPDDIQYTTSFRLQLGPEERQLGIDLRVEVWFASESDRLDVAQIVTVTKFEFQDLEPFREEGDEISLPDQLTASLLGIALSTTRGMLLGMGHHHILISNPLPILSPMRMLEQLRVGT